MKRLWPFRHFSLKLWSVVLAVLLWMVVAGEETVERGLRVPLELQQFPAGLELQGDAPSLVDVRVRGESSALSRLAPGDVVAVLDLRSGKPGRRLFQLTPEQVRVPFGVQVVQVSPPSVTLLFEVSALRKVPVVPAIEGVPAPGFVIGASTVVPPQVEVVGPETSVAGVSEALTEPVSVSGADKDVTASVTVGFQDPALRLKAPRPAVVTVQITPGPVEHTYPNRPVRLANLGPNLSATVTPPAAEIVLRGSREGLSHVSTENIRAVVDVSGLGVGEYNLDVHAEASQDAGVVRISPATVRVRINSVKP